VAIPDHGRKDSADAVESLYCRCSRPSRFNESTADGAYLQVSACLE